MFKTIAIYPGYEIYSDGRIKSYHWNRKKGRFLRPTICSTGYYKACLKYKNSKVSRFVHRLVGLAFIDNPLNKPFINHKDLNKLNNDVSNLEWSTRKENSSHAARLGAYLPTTGDNHWTHREPHRRKIGIKNGRAILNNHKVLQIRKSNQSYSKLSIKYNVCKGTISAIKSRRIWKHI